MKKALCMVALAAICLGTASAVTVKAVQDTAMHKKMKMKKKMSKMKMKKKMKDTTKKM